MRKTAIGILMLALLITLSVCAQAAVEIYEAKASSLVPAFIDYRLNCAADVTISILPSTSGGVPTGSAIRTVTFASQARGFHRYIWLAEKDDSSTAPLGYYVARINASSTRAQWDPITGLFKNDDWTHEYSGRPLPTTPDVEGFYDIAMNTRAASPYYGRIYVSHKTNKDVYMYGPDGVYLGRFNDDATPWGTSAPWNVGIGGDDFIYVSDRSNTRIFCFTPDGDPVSDGAGTYFRGMFVRTDGAGLTHIYMTGAAFTTYQVTVSADHMSWSGLQACYNSDLGDGWSAFGLYVSPNLQTAYQACMAGPQVGLTKWNDPENDGTFVKDLGFNKDLAGECTDVTLVEGASPFLWVTRMVSWGNDNTATTAVNEYNRAVKRVDPTTGAVMEQDPFDIVTWGHMSTADAVGNLVTTFGKSTASWAQKFWGVFARAGTTTAEKTTGAFQLTATPAPVVVPGSAVWTPDNTIAADNYDSASVTFDVMDVNGWADITTVTLDLRPLGYASNVACTIARKGVETRTVTATKTGIVAKVGTRCTTSNGQPPHYLSATCKDTTLGTNTDFEEVQLQVTGDPTFDAYVKHTRVVTWDVDGANIVATGGGIPGQTDPRAAGPFTYTSVPTVGGYASLEMSAGTFGIIARKLGFGSQAPVSVTVPYTGFTQNLYLRPLTVAEARATNNGTKVNFEGVCFAQPVGVAPTAANGLDGRIDTLIKRNQWYVCDANSPANGILCLVTAMSDNFILQWDDVDGTDPFGINSTYFGKRPAQGETVMITGMLDTPGGAERRVIVANSELELAMAAIPATTDRVYLNRGNIGGLPGTPATKTIADISHGMTTGSWPAWGQFVRVTGGTVVNVHTDGLPNPNPQDPAYTYPQYFTIANLAGETCEVVLETPTTLAMTTWSSTVTVGRTFTVTGAAGRRTRYGNGCIRLRGIGDLTQTGSAPDTANPLSTVRVAATGSPVNVSGIVTAKIGNSVWIENTDRSIGIRVKSNPAYIAVGNVVQVVGTIATENGERVINLTSPLLPTGGTGTIDAYDLRSREVGGVGSGTTPGVDTGRGALNVGLKIHLLGMVTAIAGDNTYYYVWDGANRADLPVSDGNADGFIGVKVEAAPPAACAAWTNYVEVTGVVSTATISGQVVPTIKPISAAKVTSFNTITAASGTALTAAWNLMSVPAAPAANATGDEWAAKPFEPYVVLGPTQDPNEIDGRMYRWENCTGGLYIWDQWSEVGSHGPFGAIVLGDGYWMQLDADQAVSYSGKNSALDQWTGVCSPGWMIIGQPKDQSTYLADVKVHDGSAIYSMYDAIMTNLWIDCTGYWWDNSTQGLVDIGIPDCWCSTDTLVPWRGYWIQTYAGDLALITPEVPAAP